MKTTLKKLTAFILAAGLMTASMTTVYASGYSYTEEPDGFDWKTADFSQGGYYHGEPGNRLYQGIEPPASGTINDLFFYMKYNSSTGENEYGGDYYWNGSKWIKDVYGYSWDERFTDAAATGEINDERYLAALAEQAAAEEAGFETVGDMHYAAEKNMSAAEYYNNVIINTPGIEEATPVGQGGKLIIDGKESGMTATFDKVARSYVDSVRTQTEGTVLNVVSVKRPAADGVAVTFNFYMPGVAGGDEITVLQYADGAWTELAVTEIRADHVVLNMERSGVIAFVRK